MCAARVKAVGGAGGASEALLEWLGSWVTLFPAMQLSLFQIVILAVVQGATEFLPVSSSGHLVVLAALLSPDGSTEGLEVSDLNIVLHGGTLLSILVFYWRRVMRLLGEDRRIIGLLVAGTLPAVAVGLPLKAFASESVLANPLLAGCMLVVTGSMLIWVSRLPAGDGVYRDLTYGQTMLIGLSQAVAILPGISRSGATISAGIKLGLSPAASATFSFLLAIPAIAGACVLEIASQWRAASGSTPPLHMATGALVSFLVGLASLTWLVRWIERGRLRNFAFWCIPLGICVVIWQLVS